MTDIENLKTGLIFREIKRTACLAEGVTYTEKTYTNREGKNVDVYTVYVEPGAKAHMEVAATPWGTTATVPDQAAALAAKKPVLAAVNAGFFHLAAGTLDPYGMQIVDGKVINLPNTDDMMHSNSWFGVTYGGKYVISDTKGYETVYCGTLRFGIGGGYRHMINGKVQYPEDTGYHPFTAIAVTKDGGVALALADGRTEQSASVSCYDMLDIFADMGLPLKDMMLLDGGGSTTIVTREADGLQLRNNPSEGGVLRPVSDIIAVVAD